jgi:hypothetical protein
MARPNRITHNGGRKLGAKGKLPQRRRQVALATIERLDRQGIMPLDVMLAVMRQGFEKSGYNVDQYRAAVDAAPYMHPKLTAIAYQPPPDEEAAERREMLAKLTFDERKELISILERARARAAVQLDASAERADGDDHQGS